jgi:HD-like signal output (HDOD) protein/ActR/RegA family two-component response regulator
MIRVLFVDDESRILKGIKRMLWEADVSWKVSYATSGSEALETIAKETFDVIVSDMRMPGMDGAALLAEVKKEHPSIVRIILSGYAEEEAILRTVSPAHQYLAKPCEADVLIDTVNRSYELRRYLKECDVREVIGGLENLPSPPGVYARFLQDIQKPSSSAKSVAKIIASDVALTAETLKLTNSAFFGLPQRIESIEHAVSMLGLDTLRALVLVAGFYSKHAGSSATLERIKLLSNRCLTIGMASRKIALSIGLEGLAADQACCAGVLSHVGTLAIVSNYEKQFEEAVRQVEVDDSNIVEAERKVLGATHQEIGAYLLGLWGFTDPILEAVAFHHEPGKSSSKSPSPLAAVHIAQEIVKIQSAGAENEGVWAKGIDENYLGTIGVTKSVEELAESLGNILDKQEEGDNDNE